VADRPGKKVLVFASDGTYESELGPTRTENGNMALSESIAVDSSGYLYILNSGDKPSNPGFFYVRKFAKDGTWQTGWGKNGTGDGDFQMPLVIAVGSADEVFVFDYGADRIQVCDSSYTYQQKGSVPYPLGIAVFPSGLALATQERAPHLQKYNSPEVSEDNFTAYVHGGYIAPEDSDDCVYVNDPGTSVDKGVRICGDVGTVAEAK
jgi:hypothetical protein